MQHSAHNASGRREDRVPLAAVVSVREARRGRTSESELEADGLNVSIGGIAMRARFVPEPGALLDCTFTCPPTGELISAQGEVMWSEPHGPGQGQFGMRFVELDTKSATALRRLVNKTGHEPPKLTRPRMARLQIDGLHAGVEAELKLVDETRIVLEQPLTFLQLGRGVEIDVPGRGNDRGRIASIELRHGQFDTPKLVFGILLDDAPSKVPAKVDAGAAWFTGELEEPFPELHAVKATASAWGKRKSEAPPSLAAREQHDEGERPSQLALDRTSELALDPPSERSLELASARFREPPKSRHDLEREAREALASASPTATLQGIGRVSELPTEVDEHDFASVPDEHHLPGQVVEVLPLTPPRVRDAESSTRLEVHERAERTASVLPDEVHDEPTVSEPVHDLLDDSEETREAHGEFTPLTLRNLPTHARILFKKQADQLAQLRSKIEPVLRDQAESLDLPEAKTRVFAFFARVRRFLVALLARRFSRGAAARETREIEETPSERRKVRLRMQRSTLPGIAPASEETQVENARGTRMIAIAVGLAGVGLAAYALAPGAPADQIELPARIANAESLTTTVPAEEALAVDYEPAAPPVKMEKKKAAPKEPKEPAVKEPVKDEPAPFGELEVPNGRVFTLRMNGPITALEGQAFENGFTVKVPGRAPVDPARPIASAHRAVKRALFMPQGKSAELTIEFLPGFAPRYQVRAKGDALEITLERL